MILLFFKFSFVQNSCDILYEDFVNVVVVQVLPSVFPIVRYGSYSFLLPKSRRNLYRTFTKPLQTFGKSRCGLVFGSRLIIGETRQK